MAFTQKYGYEDLDKFVKVGCYYGLALLTCSVLAKLDVPSQSWAQKTSIGFMDWFIDSSQNINAHAMTAGLAKMSLENIPSIVVATASVTFLISGVKESRRRHNCDPNEQYWQLFAIRRWNGRL